jgi:hypothetical protein
MSNRKPPPNYEEREDGYHKIADNPRGGASYFERPTPPVRDAETGHPIKDGKIDWSRVIREANERA